MFAYLSFLSLLIASVALAQPTGPPTGPANCATAPTLACLAGRAGTANNALISTDDNGILTGSGGASTKVLQLRGASSTSRTAGGNEVTIGDQVTSVSTAGGAYSPLEWTATPAWDGISIVNVFNASEHRIWTINSAQGGLGGARGFVYAPSVRAGLDFDNSPSTDDMGHYIGLLFTPMVQSDTSKKATVDAVTGIFDTGVLCATSTFPCDHGTGDAATVAQWTGHWFQPAPDTNATFTKAIGFLNALDNTRGTVTELNTVEDGPTIGSGRTITDRRGLYFKDKTSTGTQTNAVALDVVDQTVGTLATGMRSAMTSGTGKWHLYLTGTAPSLFGGIVTGSTAADGTLTLTGTTNTDIGPVLIYPSFSTPTDTDETLFKPGSYTLSTSGAYNLRTIEMAESVTWTGAVGTHWFGVQAKPTFAVTGTGAGLLGTAFALEYAPVSTVGGGAGNYPPFIRTLNAFPTYNITGYTAATLTPIGNTGSQGALTYTPTFNALKNGTTSGGLCGTNAGCWTNSYDAAVFYRPVLTTDDANCRMTITNSNGLYVGNATVSGAGTEQIDIQGGVTVEALTSGTANLPIQIGEAAASATGSVPAGYAAITVTSGAPNRVTFVNENEQRFDAGSVTWTGSTGAQLAADNTTVYFPVNGRAVTSTVDGPGTEATNDIAAPGALTVQYMACAVTVAPASGGGTQTRTFTLRESGAGVAPACSISEASTSCTWCQTGTSGCTATGTAEAIAVGALVAVEASASGTPAASDASCTIWWTLNAF